jgi:hypothetical protein
MKQNSQCTHYAVYRRVCGTISAVETQDLLNFPSVSVALVIQRAERMRRIILSSVACLALPYFITPSRNRHYFRGGKKFNLKCVLFFSLQLLSETFLILRRIQRDISMNF